jgi:Putative Ig domain
MEGWIMSDIRTSALGGVPFGTSATRPVNPQIGQTYYNGTLGVQEIYTTSGWLPATGANDFNVTLNGTVTTATFTKEYFAGAYTIASSLLDSSYDIYVYSSDGTQVGYTKSPSLSATGNFNKIVVIGGTQGDLLSFSYKTTFTANSTTSQETSAAFISSVNPTSLPTIDDTTTISGGNFSNAVEVFFIGSDNIERAAKSVIVSNNSVLIAKRPDSFPTNNGSYAVKVYNPGTTLPTGSNFHILSNAISAGTSPTWISAQSLTEVGKNIPYSLSLNASDIENTDIDYSLISGTLPTGLTLNQETGVISGTYSQSQNFSNSITIRATDTGGNYSDRVFTIFYDQPVLVSTPVTSFYQNGAYSSYIVVSDTTSITHSILSGSLPSGLSLNTSTGLISGTPTNNTGTSVTIRSTDQGGNYIDTSLTYLANPVTVTPNLWAYYDASSSSNYILTSGAVSQWSDLSGNGRHLTQSTSSRRPTVKVAEKNGLNVIYFDGGAKGLVTSSLTLNNPITIFVVVKMYSLASYTTIYDGVNNNEANLAGNSGNNIQLYTQGFVGGISSSTNTWYRLTHSMNMGSSYDRRNDTVTNTWSDGTVTMGGLRIGEGDGGGENGNMDIAEVIVYDRALNTSEVNNINSYLSTKWGI